MHILAFFAHPDDETMLIGGTLALLASQGVYVHYLSATRGEGGERGQPELVEQAELGALREQEMTCAIKALGGASLDFLGYEDPLVGPQDALYPFNAELGALALQVQEYIHQYQAEVVISHGSNGEYGHPAHRLTHQAALRAVQGLGQAGPLLYTTYASFEGHPKPRLVNPDDRADLIVDVAPVLEAKIQAALCHVTQNALFVRRSSQDAGRPMTVREVIVSLESLHRAYPPVQEPVDDPLSRLLLSTGYARRE